jgi:anti-sigma-K factor RskA
MDINSYIASGIVEMYVMGICSAEERTELELLRSQQPALNTAIIQFERSFENNAVQTATLEPGAATDERILIALQSLHIPAPVIAINALQPVAKTINWLKPVAAAAIILLAISGVYNYTLYKKSRAQELALEEKEKAASLPAADYAILRNPAITPVAMYGVAPYTLCRCTMYWDKKTGKAYIMIHHLVPSPKDKKYQLWATVNNKPVRVGMVRDEIRDRFIELENVPAGATAFTVTLESTEGNASPAAAETFLYGSI